MRDLYIWAVYYISLENIIVMGKPLEKWGK